jgi:O-antigen/teichoic acid export membrane protein
MSVTTPAADFEQTPQRSIGRLLAVPAQRVRSEVQTRPPGGHRGKHRRSLWQRLLSGLLGSGGWSLLIASVGINGLNFVFHALISRMLGPSHFGALGAVLNIITVLTVPLGAVQVAVTQAVAARADGGRISLRGLTIRAVLWGIGAMAALWVLSPAIDSFLNLRSPMTDVIIGVWIPVAVVGAVLQGALLAELRYVPVAVASFFGGGALRLVSGFLLVSAGFGLGGAVAATVIAQVCTTGVLLLVARSEVLATGTAPIRISLRDAALSIAALAGYTALTGIDVFLARHYLAAAVAGQYAAAAIAGRIAMFLPGVLVTVAFPRLVSARGTGISVGKTLTGTLGLVTVVGLAAFAVLAGARNFVIGVLFGPQYRGAISILWIIALTSVILGVISLLTYFHIARRSVAAMASWAGVVLVWVLVAVLRGGMDTIAYCMLAASGLVLVAVSIPAVAAVVRSSSRRGEASDEASGLVLPDSAAPDAEAAHGRMTDLPPAEMDLSLVIPFYNPGFSLAAHVHSVVGVLCAEGITFEVIAVSDGSTDGSPSSIVGIDHVRVIELPRNRGKGAALRAGLAQGRGRYLGFIDADGDIPARQLSHFLAAIRAGDPDVILGSKRHPESDVIYPPLRRVYSWGYQQLTWLLFCLPTRDTQTGIKFIRRQTLAAVLPAMLEKRFAFDLELLVVARRMGYRNFAELPVQIVERFTSTISARAVLRTLRDTLAIFYRLRIRHSYGPVLSAVSDRTWASEIGFGSQPRAETRSLGIPAPYSPETPYPRDI